MYTKIIVTFASFGVLAAGAMWGSSQSHAASRAVNAELGMAARDATATLEHADGFEAALDTAVTSATAPTVYALPHLQCVSVNSSGSTSCKDSGNFDSKCAVAKCGAGYHLTGGGGACAAGDKKIKTLMPNVSTGEYHIMCENQGVDPQARAVCCKI
jgi:hypothetical protein